MSVVKAVASSDGVISKQCPMRRDVIGSVTKVARESYTMEITIA